MLASLLLASSCNEPTFVEPKTVLELSEKSIRFNNLSNLISQITVTSPSVWRVILPVNDWLTATPDVGKAGESFTLTAKPNSDIEPRSLDITIVAEDQKTVLSITQSGGEYGVTQRDSIALVEIYNSTDGDYWQSGSQYADWDLRKTMDNWTGVTIDIIDGARRVVEFRMPNSKMEGRLPAEIRYLTELSVLDISYNTLSGEIPTEIGELKMLKKLNIASNNFTGEIPVSIGELSLLEEIDIQRNKLTIFPAVICQLSNLKYIHAENNRIASIPGEIKNLGSLEGLYLQYNQIKELPKGIGNLKKVQSFILANNQLESIPEEISQMTEMTVFNISSNKIKGTLPASFSNLVKLNAIYITGTELEGLLPDLSNMTLLNSISITNNKFTGALPDFGKMTQLTTLSLSNNAFTGEFPASIVQLPNLKGVDLSSNQLTGEVPDLSAMKKLSHFNIRENNLTGNPLAMLHKIVAARYSAIKEIKANNNMFTGEIPAECLNDDWITNWEWTAISAKKNIYPQKSGYGFSNTPSE